MMSGMLAAAVLAFGAPDEPVLSPSPVPAVRVKPKVRPGRAARGAGSDNSNSSYAALGLRAAILPSWAPAWMERAAWRVRDLFSRIRGLKATVRESILGGP